MQVIPTLWVLPIRMACNHDMDFGISVERYPDDFRQRLNGFLDVASQFPCPRCGSATGRPNAVSDKWRLIVANDIYQRECEPERIEDAIKNRTVARNRVGYQYDSN